MELVRDVLDEQVIDRHGHRLGKVDSIVVELRDGEPPRVVAIEIGAAPALRQLKIGWLARWAARRFRPTRIPVSRIRHVGLEVRVDVDGHRTNALRIERWLRERIIRRIPGGR